VLMPYRPDHIRYLRGLAARLRSIALSEAQRVQKQLYDMADEAERRAAELEASLDKDP
jgi:hypothetical protein